jgi:uroporphyrinogen decarboxylase
MPAAKMNHWERVTAAIAGEAVDHVPVSLWHHFPEIDLDPAKLAEATLRWQRTYDFDLVKFMPSGTYGIEDWGAKTAYLASPIGTWPGCRRRRDGWARRSRRCRSPPRRSRARCRFCRPCSAP